LPGKAFSECGAQAVHVPGGNSHGMGGCETAAGLPPAGRDLYKGRVEAE
jgi:hypothetical protein